ncbi:Ger(x)C family spore germination protein [Symbiobacterium terraclitae]|uniref:Ger(x)C family spore germination protein n=1 Tax=Symbiobacterium terraclitae TaxID=557451 RepID=UPI0035B554DA
MCRRMLGQVLGRQLPPDLRSLRLLPLVGLLLLLPLLAGCWNRVEIEQGAYVLAVGIDEGKVSPYAITVMIAKPGALADKEGGGDEPPVLITTVEAPSLAGAQVILHGYVGREVFFYHAQALFVHESLAREQGLPFFDELLRFRQIRETAFVVVTREPAAEVLKKLKPELDKNPIQYVEQLTYHHRNTASLPATSQVSAVAALLNVGYAQPLTYYAAAIDQESDAIRGSVSASGRARLVAGELPRRGGTPVDMIGAAAFRGSRMVGVLDGEEIRALLMLQNQFYSAHAAFPDAREPEQFVTVHLSKGRPTRITVERLGDRPAIRAEVILEAEVVAIPSGIDYAWPTSQAELEQAIASQLQETMNKVIARTQEWGADVVGFGRHAIRHFPTVQAWEAYDWPGRYPKAEINTSVRVRLRRYGLTLTPTRASEEGMQR